MTLASLPDRLADLDPNGPAVSDGTRTLTTIVAMDAIPENTVGKTDKAPLRAAHVKGTYG
ncbi:hypothetical protein [Mycobacterium sp. MMS18-G62]